MEYAENGGPAFPTTAPISSWSDPNQGMTLRDYFAVKALAALITTQASWRDLDLHPVNGKSDKQLYAMFAYQFADAMIEARNQ